MFMIPLTILFLSGVSRAMEEHVKKLRLLLKFAMRALSQLLSDLVEGGDNFLQNQISIVTRRILASMYIPECLVTHLG